MKQVGAIKVVKFQSLGEMLEWLRGDHENRSVFYRNRNHQLAVFLSWNKKTGKHDLLSGSNVDTFHIVNGPYDEDPDVESLEEFFDENDNPLEEDFAKVFAIGEFFGEEYSEVK